MKISRGFSLSNSAKLESNLELHVQTGINEECSIACGSSTDNDIREDKYRKFWNMQNFLLRRSKLFLSTPKKYLVKNSADSCCSVSQKNKRLGVDMATLLQIMTELEMIILEFHRCRNFVKKKAKFASE